MTVRVKVFGEGGKLVGPVEVARVVKSEAEWRAQLSPEQYGIARRKGTEPAFCGNLLDNKREGVYSCVCCGLPLFAADAKFNSGTGWPSFVRPIATENVAEEIDRGYGMVRTEILCARCDGHLGHVFDDGPPPTGRRYCLNSESLKFTPTEELASLVEPVAAFSTAAASVQQATAVFAGGCFWCVEAVFEELDGVIDAISGYAGGTAETANYKMVCSGTSGHAESVQIIYDPSKISFRDLLLVHFATHDPTTLHRQGHDVGPQYRSAIFYSNDEERRIASEVIDELAARHVFGAPIVTQLEPLTAFYPAESYHQGYVCANPYNGYVQGVALPKVAKVRKSFADRIKAVSPLNR